MKQNRLVGSAISILIALGLLIGSVSQVFASTLYQETLPGETIGDPLNQEPSDLEAMALTGCGGEIIPSVNEAFEQRVVELTNIERAKQGLPPLKRNTNLANAARYHSADMAQDNYFNHDTYDRSGDNLILKCNTWSRILAYYSSTSYRGENIAAGYTSPEAVVSGWMNSSGHRANILGPNFSEIGVGYYYFDSGYRHYWTQDFGHTPGYFPVVIENDALTTSGNQVRLYIYGSGTVNEMRLRNNTDSWTNWQPYQSNLTWNLPASRGEHSVSVELRNSNDPGTVYTSSDSIISSIFADVPIGYFSESYIERLYSNRITSGCGSNPLQFCPDQTVTRAQMAVFLMVSKYFGASIPLQPYAGMFADVPESNPYARLIEALAREGITSGCGGGNFCPNSPVTRDQMAVFLLKAKYGNGLVLNEYQGRFLDVPETSPYIRFIEKLAAEGVTSGCGGGNYCPSKPVTRGQMAVFLVINFGLP